MAVRNKAGHAVTSVLPGNSDAVTVAPVSMPYQEAPANQSGGVGGPKVARDSRSSYPPKGKVSSANVGGRRGSGSSSTRGVY